jgi:hypothetical protein
VNALPQKGDRCLKRPIPDGVLGQSPDSGHRSPSRPPSPSLRRKRPMEVVAERGAVCAAVNGQLRWQRPRTSGTGGGATRVARSSGRCWRHRRVAVSNGRDPAI